MSDVISIVTKRYQCRHIFTDGRRCGSPCLTREEFCYYHHTTRRAAARTRSTGPETAEFDLPLAEDRSAIQISIGEVLRRIARNEIDPRRAGLLLYGLQIASLNIARAAEPARDKELIEEITADPELGTVAPTAELTDPEVRRSNFATTLIEEFKRMQAEQREADASNPAANAPEPWTQPAILPLIQACHRTSLSPRRRRVDLRGFPDGWDKRHVVAQISGYTGSRRARDQKRVDGNSSRRSAQKGVTDEWSASFGWDTEGRVRPDVGRKAQTVERQ